MVEDHRAGGAGARDGGIQAAAEGEAKAKEEEAPPPAPPPPAPPVVNSVELSEIVPVPDVGRIFERPLRPGLADAASSGRVRLDAIARWVQDLAYADVEDA